ncbi:hypothetical protein, partial [Undibacterium sp.]|uniref:hypothetical protein n=1 Tax=Undibacterium sp. TaxID=1914977 RepID=UPI0037506DE5
RRIFGHFFRSSLQIASYLRLIHVKTASKSASTIISNPNGNSGLNVGLLGCAYSNEGRSFIQAIYRIGGIVAASSSRLAGKPKICTRMSV